MRSACCTSNDALTLVSWAICWMFICNLPHVVASPEVGVVEIVADQTISAALKTTAGHVGDVVLQGSPAATLDATELTTPFKINAASLAFENLTLFNLSLTPVPQYEALNRLLLKQIQQKPSPELVPDILRPQYLVLDKGRLVYYRNVHIVTTCSTLQSYQSYVCAGAWQSDLHVNSTHIHADVFSMGLVVAYNLSISCFDETSGLPFMGSQLAPCLTRTVNNGKELYDAFQQQQNYLQIVAFLNASFISLTLGAWPTTVSLFRTVVIQGRLDMKTTVDFCQRIDIISVVNATGVLVYIDSVVTQMRYDDTVLDMPPQFYSWDIAAQTYLTSLPTIKTFMAPIYLFNSTFLMPCDYMDLYAVGVEQLNSIDAEVRTRGQWVTKLLLYTVNWSHKGILLSRFFGIKFQAKNLWVTCGLPQAPGWGYSGLMDLTGQGRFSFSPSKMYGVLNASALLQRIHFGQSAINDDRDGNDGSIMVFLANISFADLPEMEGNLAGTKTYANSTSQSFPIQLKQDMIWGRWANNNITLDFGYRVGLFEILPGVRIHLRNLTLVRLPCLCDGTQLGLWGAAVWPFSYDRSATSRLSLMQVTLQLTYLEIEHIHRVLHEKLESSNVSGLANVECVLGAVCAVGFRHVCNNATTHVSLGCIDDSRVEVTEVKYFGGLGYEATTIILLSVGPDVTNYEGRMVVALDAMFDSFYGNASPPPDGDSSNASNLNLGVILGASIGGCVLVVLLLVAVVVILVKRKRSRMSNLGEKEGMWRAPSLVLSNSAEGSSSLSNRRLPPCQLETQATDIKSVLRILQPSALGCAPHFDVGRLIGAGSSSKVYHGHWLGIEIALKVVPLLPGHQEQAVMEAAILNSVAHPNIVVCYSYITRELDMEVLRAQQPQLPRRSADTAPSLPSTIDSTIGQVPPHQSTASTAVLTKQKVHLLLLGLEYCDGGALDGALQGGGECASGNGKLAWRTPVVSGRLGDEVMQWPALLYIGQDIAHAVRHLHCRGLVHGDIKPSNVLLCRASEGNRMTAKVSDFGLSRMLLDDQTHQSNILVGTMFYAPPELLLGGQLGRPADIYALGIILWELFHGLAPWHRTRCPPVVHSGSLLHYDKSCPVAYANLCRACTLEEPKERPTSEEVVAVLDLMCQDFATARDWRADSELGLLPQEVLVDVDDSKA